MSPPDVITTVAALRATVRGWRDAGLTVAVVPTMGALHDGHLQLVRVALERAARVVVTIFVNPAQFSPSEDLDRYPRDEAGDLRKLAAVGAQVCFMPDVGEMYPDGFASAVRIAGLSEGLCGASRPHHFGGVATVVAKLLNQAGADFAMFGEKDYQQLLVVRRMAADLDIPTEIVGVPTVREPDGLALSSRNAYLDEARRRVAPMLYAELGAAARDLGRGAAAGARLGQTRAALEAAGFDAVEYVELRAAETLEALDLIADRPGRLLAAVMLGGVRLIDNVPVDAAR
ncbi:MAG: pantoate--beta-alanine ligase [Pseudomonadota bacterium]